MERGGKKKKNKSGGFQSMGLCEPVFRGVMKKGYKVPTPIQRRTIPVILKGNDVVGMARTGSGKTAAFLIPMLQRLVKNSHMGMGDQVKTKGARALILSPTRELAIQTLKFAKALGRYTGLKAVSVLGGDSMEKQFAVMHENPDIIIATPGRFVHVCVEMSLKLNAVEYVVFDEADRLFEMGFGDQLREILARLPEDRQTVLFSATLPKLLVDFAKAGLTDPTLIRLDVDTKIPDTLKMAFFSVRPESKTALLLHLLHHVIPQDQQVVVFSATRHHIEYLHLVLDAAKVSNSFIYSQLDPTARKINSAKFSLSKCRVLLVTDLAARGIDIPLLDNVVNFHFPAKPKLFVHRVGRVARAGRSGMAYSFVAGDELAYYLDLQLFLGQSVTFCSDKPDQEWHNQLGRVPQSVDDDYTGQLTAWTEKNLEMDSLIKVAANGYKQYLKSRPGASVESVRRVKELQIDAAGFHPLLNVGLSCPPDNRGYTNLIDQLKQFRPHSTIFEIGNTSKNDKLRAVMSVKRQRHSNTIEKFHSHPSQASLTSSSSSNTESEQQPEAERPVLESSSQEEIQSAFSTIVEPKVVHNARVFQPKKKQRKMKVTKDEENYIPYQSKDFHTEAGYSMMSGFEAQASHAVLDLTGDDDQAMRAKKNVMRWDVKKKKYVKAEQGQVGKKIKTESGVWIPASYKSNRYAKWMERSKIMHHPDQQQPDDDDLQPDSRKRKRVGGLPANHPAMKKAREAVPKHKKGPRSELKRPEQILKARKAQNKSQMKKAKGGKSKGKGRTKKSFR